MNTFVAENLSISHNTEEQEWQSMLRSPLRTRVDNSEINSPQSFKTIDQYPKINNE